MTLTDERPPTRSAPEAVRVDVAEVPAEVLEADIVALASRLAAGTYELLVRVGELDTRGTWAASGALSCAAWLAQVCDVELCTARTQVRVARALRTHPVLDAAMASGDVSYAKARVLVPHLTATSAAPLVALAAQTPAGRLGQAIAAWSQRHDDPADIDARHHRERSVSWRTDADGMVTLTARLPPAQAGALIAVIDATVTARPAPAGASLRHQRADALLTLLTDDPHPTDDPDPDAPAGASRPRVTAEIVIHVRPDGTTLADGTPLTDHTVTRLLPDAFVSLLIRDTHGHPIDASPRRRAPTRRQRRVLDERHPTCQHSGCNARVLLLDDHIHPYAQNGPTTLDNLTRCQYVLRVLRPASRRWGGAGSPQAWRRQSDFMAGVGLSLSAIGLLMAVSALRRDEPM